jgi:plasmid stabilization system protein ParE
MTHKLIIKEEAIRDITEAALWYSQKQSLLGNKFIEEVEGAFNSIHSNPFLYQVQKKNIRYGYIKRFPYMVIYEIDENDIIVYGVIQAQRNPKKRYSRAKKK